VANQPLGTAGDPPTVKKNAEKRELLLRLLIFTVVISMGLFVPVERADAACTAGPTTYTTPGTFTYTVPSGCDSVFIQTYGAGGGGSTVDGGGGGGGGSVVERTDTTLLAVGGGGGGGGARKPLSACRPAKI
jgi:hypothetical protein